MEAFFVSKKLILFIKNNWRVKLTIVKKYVDNTFKWDFKAKFHLITILIIVFEIVVLFLFKFILFYLGCSLNLLKPVGTPLFIKHWIFNTVFLLFIYKHAIPGDRKLIRQYEPLSPTHLLVKDPRLNISYEAHYNL